MTTAPHKFASGALMISLVNGGFFLLKLAGVTSSFFLNLGYWIFCIIGGVAAILLHFVLDWISHIDPRTFRCTRKSLIAVTIMVIECMFGVFLLWLVVRNSQSWENISLVAVGAFLGLLVDIFDELIPDLGFRGIRKVFFFRHLHKIHYKYHTDVPKRPIYGIMTQLVTIGLGAFIIMLFV